MSSKTKKKNSRRTGDKPAAPPRPYDVPTIDGADWDADIALAARVPLFTIKRTNPDTDEDETVTYDMPAREDGALWLRFLGLARRIGDELAASWLLEEVIGSEAHNELSKQRGVKSSTIQAISLRVVTVISGKAVDVDYEATLDEVDDESDDEDRDPADPS